MRILTISGHCQDRFTASFTDGIHSKKQFGPFYVAKQLGVGSGDDINLQIDIDTGKIIGWVTPTEEQLKEVFNNEDNE